MIIIKSKRTGMYYSHKVFVILLISLLVAINTSCTDEALKVTNENQVTEDTFYKTEDDALASIYSAYAVLQANDLWGRNIQFLLDFPADEIHPTINTLGTGVQIYNHTYTPTNGLVESVWNRFYDLIGKTNSTIKNIPAIKGIDPKAKSHILAEAHFLRALAYFYINSLYGGGPLRTTDNLDEVNTPRASEAVIWTQVEKDLDAAKENLPAKLEWPSSEQGRATSGAAFSLLGKTYLFQEQYAKAEAEFQKVIDQNVYHLIQSSEFGGDVVAAMYSNFEPKIENDNNAESVFEVQYNGGGSNSNGIGKGESSRRPYEYGIQGEAWYNCYPSDDLIDAYQEDDPRLEAFYFGPNSTYLGESYDFAGKGWGWRKFQTTDTPEVLSDSPVNIDIIRYADILLMMAEAKIKQNDIQGGLKLINRVRRRADPSGNILSTRKTTSKQQAMDYLIHERRLELSGEQTRFLDLVRWELAKKELSSFQIGKNEVFPIPQGEINNNTAMNQEDQNAGY